jgi:hydroxymethylpyrimidine pyrophosphatase-like HAD family hydrolase
MAGGEMTPDPKVYAALATDYDGTLACEGKVDETTLAALVRAREAGLKLVMVTGRELSDLFNTFPHSELFDRVVAENGAVLYNPSSKSTRMLSEAPPAELVRVLTEKRVPMSVGHSIVATVEPHEHTLLTAIRDLAIEWHVIFNKGSVMALPSGVTKATGLVPALTELELSPSHTVGIGDAENDHEFLSICGFSAAVANALPALKAAADLVTNGPRGHGVIEVIDRVLAGTLPERVVRS